jgi:hypothetical protein
VSGDTDRLIVSARSKRLVRARAVDGVGYGVEEAVGIVARARR